MKRGLLPIGAGGLLLGAALLWQGGAATGAAGAGTGWTLVAWNDLGMHCMDSNYAVFSVLPPFNTVDAQLIDPQGDLVTNPGSITVTYEATGDATGSMNKSSVGKTDFWDHALELYGAPVSVDQGLAGNDMPGAANAPQPMQWDAANVWFTAVGIPITSTDDAGVTNSYPTMLLTARDGGGSVLATAVVVLPVSTEMDCRACHASGAGPAAEPAAGWVFDGDYELDYRLNILRLHDELQAGDPLYASALAARGFDPAGLYANVASGAGSILCAACHGSNALPGTGYAGVSPLTAAVHGGHADVVDPVNGMTLDASANRSSCYRCHPGSETRCLRGAMGSAVAPDGELAMQCQSCHGTMSQVGDPARTGWLEEPACQSCHTGTATSNNGQIRYESVFEPGGAVRVAVNATFATDQDVPAAGFSLYRFSTGHGELQCSACHGSTHAIYPGSHGNDNLQVVALQGHAGTISECSACHQNVPDTVSGGPHGLHPLGQSWIDDHKDAAEHGGAAQCAACHGSDYRGTVLSRSLADRTLNTEWGPKTFWRGFQIGCYDCHQGPDDDDRNHNVPPVAQDATAATSAGVPVVVTLLASDPDGGTPALRIVQQPAHGTVALAGDQATYRPETGFAGDDAFTFAAGDGETESNLATVGVAVGAGVELYGEGHPGTNGVPSLTATGLPTLGSQVLIHMGNAAGVQVPGFVVIGATSDYQPTPFGGVYLVEKLGQRAVTIPASGLTRGTTVPSDPSVIGTSMILQLVHRDPGASHGFAFSRALRLVRGL